MKTSCASWFAVLLLIFQPAYGLFGQGAKTPEGRWTSSIAPDYPMIVKKTPKGLSISWKPTIDSDISIEGILTDQGGNLFSGAVDFASGDTRGKRTVKIIYRSADDSLSLELKTMWEEPVLFIKGNRETGDVLHSIN